MIRPSLLLLNLLPSVLLLGAQERKVSAPDAAAQKESEKLVREVFKDDYAKKSPADRIDLAKKLLQQGLETRDDPTSKFVLLREARDVAASAGDVGTALAAVDEMARRYEIDLIRTKLAAFSTVSQEARTPEALKLAAEALIKLSDDAVAADDAEGAEKAAAMAVTSARKSKDIPLITRAEAKSREAAGLKSSLARLKSARDALAANPDDPAANLQVGQHECFVRGNWEAGLPLLAKSSEETLRSLARKELAVPGEGPDQIAVGDGWWERAEKEGGAAREKIREHAGQWYGNALGSASGLSKAKIEKRLAELASKRGSPKGLSDEGLVGWWKLDEGSGLVADDASGRKNHGKLSGAVEWTEGRSGKALRFNGAGGRVTVPDSPSLRITGDLTISFWFRRDGDHADWVRLIGKGSFRDRNFGIFVGGAPQGPELNFQQYDPTPHTCVDISSRTRCEKGTWYHVAAVVRGENGLIYVGGKEEISRKRNGLPVTSSDPLIFGFAGYLEPLTGALDDIRIYTRALTEAEIQILASMK